MSARRLTAIGTLLASGLSPRTARADNCSGLSDCSWGIKIALVLAAIVLVFLLWQFLPILSAQAALASSRIALMSALRAAGVKFAERAVIGIARTVAGRLVWLETGTAAAGLKHILERHASQFAAWGMNSGSQVANLIMTTVRTGTPFATGALGSADYLVRIGGVDRAIRIITGANGFIVSAYPIPLP